MSYNVLLVIDTGASELTEVADIGIYTYNVSPMCYKALIPGGLNVLDGLLATDAIPILEKAIRYFDWGNNYSHALDSLRVIMDACRKHPKTTVRIT